MEFVQLKCSKNLGTSPKELFALSRETHKYLIQPISKTRHIKISLMKRYIRFSKKFSTSEKNAARNLFNSARKHCQSNTGYNLRKIMHHNADLVDDFTKIPDISYLIMSRGAFR